MDQRRRIPLHQSLVRPILLGGAERDFALVFYVISAGLVFGIGSWQAAVFGICFALVAQVVLVHLAKKDCQFLRVWIRQLNYRDYYPAQSWHCAPSALVKYLFK